MAQTIGPVFIKSKKSGKVMDVYGGFDQDCTPIIQYDKKSEGFDNQLFTFEKVGERDGKPMYKVVSKFSGKVLDIYESRLGDAVPCIEYHYHGGVNQMFFIDEHEGSKVIVNCNSGKALDVEGGSTDNEAKIIQYDRHNGPNQCWDFIPGGPKEGTEVCVQDAAAKVEYVLPPVINDDTWYRVEVVFTNKLPVPISNCYCYIDVDENSPFHSERMKTSSSTGDQDTVKFDFGSIPAKSSKSKFFSFSFPKLDAEMPKRNFKGIFQLSPHFQVDYTKYGGTSQKINVTSK